MSDNRDVLDQFRNIKVIQIEEEALVLFDNVQLINEKERLDFHGNDLT